MELLQVALAGIRVLATHPLRSFLAALGIVFGVGAVIAMVAVGEGAQREILRQIESMGASIVRVRQNDASLNSYPSILAQSAGLSEEDFAAILDLRELLEADSIAAAAEFDLQFGPLHQDLKGKVFGITPEFSELNGLRIVQGRNIHPQEYFLGKRVVLVGADLASKLGLQPDQILSLHHHSYIIVGIYQGRSGSADSGGKRVFLPFSAMTGILKTPDVYGEFQEIQIDAGSLNRTALVKKQLETLFIHRHRGVHDYEIHAPVELLHQRNEQQRILNVVLLSIAAISLLVGGIGVMNIMLANILERIPEIGLRRAIGARRRTIFQQFLVESLVICILGGMAGLVVGCLLAFGIEVLTGMKVAFRLDFTLLALLISSLAGLVFGVAPALQAMRVSPMEALRRTA